MGQLIIYIAFLAALLSSAFYFYAYYRKVKFLTYARFCFHTSVVMTISSAAYLLYLIITHQFQFTYVWNYSSRDLPLNLLISTFYAGQEGSFHLWAFQMTVLGIFLLSYMIKRDREAKERFEPLVMGLFMLLQTFLLFILIIKSPYKYIWESFPKDAAVGFVPEDGRGLNPLLQNFWMSIHPPILFLGFSSLAIPYCFAVTALIRNEYGKWMKLAMPWALLSGMVLGTGIMLGGFWAYGVLGWGGYWGWDPVENSSFVPWIVIIAAIHTMVSGQRTGGFKKSSLLLCILAYVMVLYSTFMTRSGVLGDASVHSFVDPGQEVYLFLIVLLSLFGAGGIGLILYRLKSLKPVNTESANLLSRESGLFVGAVTLCAAALVIAVGTSLPIFSKGTVDPSFYNRMNLPIAILIAVINGLTILLKWRHSEEKEFLKSLLVPLGLTGALTIVLVIAGIRDILMGVFAGAALFAFFINIEMAYRLFLKSRVKAGPYIAHLGIMILFLGIIGSSRYSQEVNVSLPLDETKEALGYELTYKGATPIPGDEQKYHFNVIAEKDGKAFLLQPIMYYSEYSQGVMKNPDIANLVTKDLYLSPMGLETPQAFDNDDVVSLNKGEEKEFRAMKLKFIDFDRSKFNRDDMTSGKDNIMGAELEITINGKTEKLTAEQKITGGSPEYTPVQLAGSDRYAFYLTNISVKENSAVDIAVVDNTVPKQTNTPETLVLAASIKPFINLVWGGTITMVLGFFLSLIFRLRAFKSEAKLQGRISTNGARSNGSAKIYSNNNIHTKQHKKKRQIDLN